MTFYEMQEALDQYLLFHYGEDADLMPYPFGPKDALHFPLRCVTEGVDLTLLPPKARALELGCAVGRSSFELTKYCQSVTGVDYSSTFISVAQQIQQKGEYAYTLKEEGVHHSQRTAYLPKTSHPDKVTFIHGDAAEFVAKEGSFDVVLAANLICRLKDPVAFLSSLKNTVVKGGQLILTAPYSWLEEYTPQSAWLGKEGKGSLECLREILEGDFELLRHFDMPFLIREHARKFQWGVSQATVWKRKF